MTATGSNRNELSGLTMMPVVSRTVQITPAQGGKRISYNKENMTNTPRADHQLIQCKNLTWIFEDIKDPSPYYLTYLINFLRGPEWLANRVFRGKK